MTDFSAFFERWYSALLARMILLCRHRQNAEDAIQEAFTEALLRWDRIGRYESPEGWVYKIARQRLTKALRRTARFREVGADVSQPPVASAEDTSLTRLVLDALSELPERQRHVIVRHCLEGWSQQEIADDLGCSRGAVAASIHKGRGTMMRKLGLSVVKDSLVAQPGWATSEGAAQLDPLSAALRAACDWVQLGIEADRATIDQIRTAIIERAGSMEESRR